MLTDTHCHLYYDEIKKDIANVLKRSEKLGVNRFICVGTNIEDSLQCLELAEIKVLSDFPDVIGVAHCFSSTISTAKTLLDMGYYISFSGNLTFKNSNLPEVAKYLPLDRILVETDSPYLSPVPYRGKRNEPGRTRYVAEKLAEIHQVPLELVARKTTENANRLFYL